MPVEPKKDREPEPDPSDNDAHYRWERRQMIEREKDKRAPKPESPGVFSLVRKSKKGSDRKSNRSPWNR